MLMAIKTDGKALVFTEALNAKVKLNIKDKYSCWNVKIWRFVGDQSH